MPRLEEFAAKKLQTLAIADPVIGKYLPEMREKRGLNRQYLFNVSPHTAPLNHLLQIVNSLKPAFFT